MNTKVTVIVPVYKAESYIEKCAYSLFNQTLTNVEFIFVNDASPDNSILTLEKVVSEYPEIKKSVTILHNSENLGPAISRNRALDIAKGEYIIVVDSDDYIDENMLEVMYIEALKTKADIVVCDMSIEFENKTIYFNDYVSEDKSDYLAEMLTNQKSSPSLCNKLIKKDLYINSNCRNNGKAKYMEDRFVCTRLYYYASKIVKINRAFYHYNKKNTNATTHKYGREHFESLKNFWNDIDRFLVDNEIHEKYKELVIRTKLKDKIKLMMYVDSYITRKEYSFLFDENLTSKYVDLKIGEKLMLFFIQKKMFIFTTLLRKLIELKTMLSKK